MSRSDPPFLPYGRQDITNEDVAAVAAVLRSDWLTQGPAIDRFEADLCALTDAGKAVATANATCALHIASLACGLGPGDVAWTSPNSFVASANCALYCGADVDFVDIDPESLNMSVEALERKLVEADAAGRLPKIVIPVHFAGQSCDMAAIEQLSRRYGFRVIEDASHAIGGQYHNRPVGSCDHSDVTVFSFHPVKIVTTGEGGAALTNDPALGTHMARLRTHGITRAADEMEGPGEGGWYYEQLELGFNHRMTDIQAALGSSQLVRIADYLARRHQVADWYDEALAPLPMRRPVRLPERYSASHLYVVQLDDAGRRRHVFDALRAAGIGVNVHYIPIHLQPFYRRRGFAPGDFPQAEDYYARAISLPMHARMVREDVDRVVGELSKALT